MKDDSMSSEVGGNIIFPIPLEILAVGLVSFSFLLLVSGKCWVSCMPLPDDDDDDDKVLLESHALPVL